MGDALGERVAVIDVGTNSTRLLIAEVGSGRVQRELVHQTTVTRLGAGVDAGGRLSPAAMERVIQAIDAYHAELDATGVDRSVAVLTSAVRDSANGDAFAAQLRERYGFEAHVLSGEREAQLTYLGATGERPLDGSRRTLVIDIGGGSTELVIGRGRRIVFHASTQAGVVRQSERHIHTDPPTKAELEALAADLRGLFSQAVPPRERRAHEAIAVAGTPTSLAAIAQRLEPYDPERVHGYRLRRETWEQVLARLSTMTLPEREGIPGLLPARAPTILPGIVILAEAMALFDLDEVEVSEHDILRGAALGL